jgi:Flp pilus assembly protein TadG
VSGRTRRMRAWGLIELALVLPLLLTILLGTVAVGRILWYDQAVRAVASDAARAGALGSSAADAEQRASRRASELAQDAGLDPRRLQVAIDTSAYGRGGWVVVQARYEVLPIVPVGAINREGPWWVGAEGREPVDRYRSGVGR